MSDHELSERVRNLEGLARDAWSGIWRIENKLDAILRELKAIQNEEKMEAQELIDSVATLKEQVTQTTTLEQSAILLITSIPGLLNQAAGSGPDAIRALAAELNSKGQELAAALLANTPGAPPGPVVAPATPTAPADPAPADPTPAPATPPTDGSTTPSDPSTPTS